MLELLARTIIDTGLQAVGWGVMKGVSFGRYRGFQPEDVVLEATLGFVTLAVGGYCVYRWLF
jgi:hypothetical protein